MPHSVIQSQKLPGVLAVAATSLIIAAGLNLNGFLALLTGQSQLVSVVFAVSAIVVVTVAKPYWTANIPIMAFLIAITSYVIFGAFYSSMNAQATQLSYIITYLASVLIVAAMAAYSLQLTDRELRHFVRLTKNIFLITSVAILFSPVINRVYLQLTDTPNRYSGFFSNPNEAGMAAAIALLLVLATGQNSRRSFWIAIAVAVGACLSTLSRSAMIAAFIVSVIYAVGRKQWLLLVGLVILAILASLIISFVLASDNRLTSDQISRLADILSLLGGNLNAATSGSRIDLFQIGLGRVADIFPFGDGLGSFHFLFGGIRSADAGYWLGVHNTYLMILGESGAIPFFMFLFANLAWLVAIIRRGGLFIDLGYFVILQVNFLTAHDTMGLRFEDVMLGLMLGTLARSVQRRPIAYSAGRPAVALGLHRPKRS
jgi:O-antigen ligase